MPLVAQEAQGPKERPPWRGLVVGMLAALLFIVILAVSAYATNDTTRGVPMHDGGVFDAGFADAGELVVDAGTAVGPITEPDAGFVVVPGPPVDAQAVVAAVTPVVERCLQAALRFDPGLGGKAVLRVLAGHGALTSSLSSSPSPVLSACVLSQGHVAFPAAAKDPVVVEAKLALDGLRGTVRVDAAELAP